MKNKSQSKLPIKMYHYSDAVQFTPSPATGYVFTGWSGDLLGSANMTPLPVSTNTKNKNEVIDSPNNTENKDVKSSDVIQDDPAHSVRMGGKDSKKEADKLDEKPTNEPSSKGPEPPNPKTKVTANTVKATVEKNFPGLWPPTEAVLSSIVTLFFEDIKDPASLFLVGPPSSEKGTVLGQFKKHPMTYWSDKFTPAAFVSQAANKTPEQLRKIDLLLKIKDKALVVAELSPVFNSRQDILKENIAILTRVLDGEGLMVDTGTNGRRGYDEELRFTFNGATTPPKPGLWNTLGKLGNRLCFYHMPLYIVSPRDFAKELQSGNTYKAKLEENRIAVTDLLDQLQAQGPIKWNRQSDPVDVIEKIAKLAEMSGKLRGVTDSVYSLSGRGYVEGFTQIESLPRFTMLLYNLARSRAVVNDRKNIDASDLELVREVALSSCYEGRYLVMKFLIANNFEADTDDIIQVIGCSRGHALDLMRELERLEIVEKFQRNILVTGGKKEMIRVKVEYQSVLV